MIGVKPGAVLLTTMRGATKRRAGLGAGSNSADALNRLGSVLLGSELLGSELLESVVLESVLLETVVFEAALMGANAANMARGATGRVEIGAGVGIGFGSFGSR